MCRREGSGGGTRSLVVGRWQQLPRQHRASTRHRRHVGRRVCGAACCSIIVPAGAGGGATAGAGVPLGWGEEDCAPRIGYSAHAVARPADREGSCRPKERVGEAH